MKNKLVDLNDHLFAQLERLSDEDLSGTALDVEVQRAKTIVDIADVIVGGARVQLDAPAEMKLMLMMLARIEHAVDSRMKTKGGN